MQAPGYDLALENLHARRQLEVLSPADRVAMVLAVADAGICTGWQQQTHDFCVTLGGRQM